MALLLIEKREFTYPKCSGSHLDNTAGCTALSSVLSNCNYCIHDYNSLRFSVDLTAGNYYTEFRGIPAAAHPRSTFCIIQGFGPLEQKEIKKIVIGRREVHQL